MKLHIGGKEYKEGWKILNIQPAEHVDFVGSMTDLSQFEEDSCEQIYTSHTFEHIKLRDALPTLQGIWRILQPGGSLMLSVPDLEVLSQLFVLEQLPLSAKLHVVRMIFGGQVDAFDFHYMGYNFALLKSMLEQAGFKKVKR